ncbi:MAG: hypothetical protein GQ583_09010, partial [Methyloprofundus sp.]|nr:hypothetical protein [Methyloprofundus sp.]
MHELIDGELYKAIEYAKNIDQETGRSIIEQFQADQPILSQTIFSLFPTMISAQNQDMAHLFMDLCFDVICIYQHAFGDMPAQSEEWLKKQAALMEAELQEAMQKNKKDGKLQGSSKNEVAQAGLVKFMNDSIDAYAAEIPGSAPSIKMTQTMIFTVIRLFT